MEVRSRRLREHPLPWLLLDFVLPTRCFCCGERLGRIQSHGACGACWQRLTAVEDDRLGEPSAAFATVYSSTARCFLLRAKFGPRRELFASMAAMLVAVAARTRVRADCVVPVPSHPWSDFKRGFSPAVELARPLAADLRLPLVRAVQRRWAPWTTAKRLSRTERVRFARRAFRLARPLHRLRVLLVDDVSTTGATLASCKRLCARGGATEVNAVVWARNDRGGAPG